MQPIVTGLPNSGNHVVSDLVGGGIYHYGHKLNPQPGQPIVIILRDPETHWRSVGRDDFVDTNPKHQLPNPTSFETVQHAHYHQWTRTLAALDGHTPLVVHYSSIVQEPEKYRRLILDHCGVGDRPWPKPVRDEDAKWRM